MRVIYFYFEMEMELLGVSQDDGWDPSLPENLVSIQQMDISFLLGHLNKAKHRRNQRIHVAQTLLALCRNPFDYYGYNLLGETKRTRATKLEINLSNFAVKLRFTAT